MAQNINPIALLATVDHVYVVTSLLGFEALMLGKRVTCFGAPFYAGWGLTDDRLSLPRRHQRRTLTQLFAAAYILYPRYLDPDTGKRAAIEQVVTHLETQRHHFTANRGRIYCFGFSLWKRNYIRAYLKAPGNQIRFVRSLRQARRLGLDSRVRIAVWGAKARADLEALARAYDVPIWRVEDGFLRSVGLGSDLTAPASLVVDTRGIYFDPAGPSDLEHLLQEKPFTEAELDRARQLRAAILALGLSKYNVGAQGRLTVAADPGQRRLLVPGQVPDDASIRLGCGKICSDVALLQTVRAEHPRAFLLYKPHPDLLSGNRRGRIDRALLAPICDQVVLDHSIADCLAMADEVHTMTSLVGFEALLRGLRVITYGMPFYAGWGLTEDRIPIPRRSRRLTLDELVAGVLIGYPRYLTRRRAPTPAQPTPPLPAVAGPPAAQARPSLERTGLCPLTPCCCRDRSDRSFSGSQSSSDARVCRSTKLTSTAAIRSFTSVGRFPIAAMWHNGRTFLKKSSKYWPSSASTSLVLAAPIMPSLEVLHGATPSPPSFSRKVIYGPTTSPWSKWQRTALHCSRGIPNSTATW